MPRNSLAAAGGALTNLPVPLTSFVGRRQDAAAVGDLLGEHRLVTLAGPGGCGKTRLALKVAADRRERYPDGVWLVELSGLADPELLPEAVSSVLAPFLTDRVPAGSDRVRRLASACQPLRTLLILDNCEHLVEGCARLSHAFLSSCPGISLLCTSRESLGVPGEITYEMEPLSVPDEIRSPAELMAFESVQLFVARAQAVWPAFAVNPENAEAVVRICRHLDGLPLAIELAAARVKVLSTRELADRLHDRFVLLKGNDRLALPRHQTLRATVDWSYGLLSTPEQVLWRRLSLFAGRFSLESAEAVCHGGVIEREDVLRLVSLLVDKSVVAVSRTGEQTRYHLLETMKHYGLERLAEAAEAVEYSRRYLEHYRHWVLQSGGWWAGPERAQWCDRLEQEHDNLQAALAWSKQDPASRTAGLQLAAALGRFWDVRGRVRQGLKHLDDLLALEAEPVPGPERAQALIVAGALAFTLGEYSLAHGRWEESLTIARRTGADRRVASVLNNMGLLARCEGNHRLAEERFDESLAIWRRLEMKACVANTLVNLADLMRDRGDWVRAEALYEESLACWRELAGIRGQSEALLGLGTLKRHQGEAGQALALLTDALRLAGQVGDRELMILCMERIAGWHSVHGVPERAALLFGAASAHRAQLGVPVPAYDVLEYDRDLSAVRGVLGDDLFAEQHGLGAAMGLEEAAEQALWAGEAAARPVARIQHLLTQREVDVVRLVAQGITDREVGARLHISRYTVNNHLRNIFGKLSITSRSALVAWAFRQGLAEQAAPV